MQQSKDYSLRSKVYLTGNIGLTQPLEILDELKHEDWVVYELSSFQLQDLQKSPFIGVVLMTTSEHLNYHNDLSEYLEAKSTITKFQTSEEFAVINVDFPSSVYIGMQGKGKKLFFSRKNEVENGCFVKNNEIIVTGQTFQLPISNIQLRGAHNLENICAAITASICAKVDLEIIKKATKNFKGLEHRLEFVGDKKGIKFYNDSFSTTPETAIAGILSFFEPLVVILGGSKKMSDFTELGKVIFSLKNIKALILIGDEAERIKSVIINSNIQIFQGAKTMPEIFEQIKSVAKEGDVVLLSPACASFDLFTNYKDRGGQFKELVNKF